MNPEQVLPLIFNVISIFYAFRALQIAAIVSRKWAVLKGPTFTSQTKNLASRASFFLAVPVGVFLHELSHALAILQFGGQVSQFNYRVFWGYVIANRNFLANQEWFIALAGTLASLLFGLFCWLALKDHSSPNFRYFGLRAFRYQIYFSLLYYPLFTLLGFNGDWRTIYNFEATPIASGATAVFHVGVLLWFYRAERNGFFEMGAFGSPEEKEKISALEEKVEAFPYDTAAQLELIQTYQQAGMANKAKEQVQKLLKENPNSAEAYLQLALIEGMDKREIPSKAKNHALQALSLGLREPATTAAAHLIVGRYNLAVNKLAEAIDQFSQGFGAVRAAENRELPIRLLYYRALAYRRKRQYDAAYQDIQQAITLAHDGKHEQALTWLNNELQIITRHSGRSPDQFTAPPS